MSNNDGFRIDERPCGDASIFVLDDVFDTPLVSFLDTRCRRMPYTLSDYDTAGSEENRHWKSELDIGILRVAPVFAEWLSTIEQLVARFLPAFEVEVRRVHVNCEVYGGHQHAHTDLPGGATALYYANAEWEQDWQGETVFYDRNGDACAIVAPQPGRLALFPADIPHRAGAPSRATHQPRFSVAVKFAPA